MFGSEDRIKQIKSDLSEFDLRDLNLADFTSKNEARFHKYIKGVCQRLLGDTINLDEKDVLFALSDEEGTNAAHSRRDDVTVIYLTEGIFRLCRNEDQLAFILGHELGHYEERLRYGEDKDNSNAEETACDLRAIQKMARGGYNLEEACNVAERIFNRYYIDIKDLRDPHTNSGSRVNLINAMKKKERDRVMEEQNIEVTSITPIPDDIVKMVQDRNKRTPMKEILREHMDKLVEKYEYISDMAQYDAVCGDAIIDEWMKLFYENTVSHRGSFAITETDAKALIECLQDYLWGNYEKLEDRFLARVFAEMEAKRNDPKLAVYADIMHEVLNNIRIEDDDGHYATVDAGAENSKTAGWLKHYLHGFREAEGDKFAEVLENWEYVQKFIAEPYYNEYKGFRVKNFNIFELEFNENDVGKKFSPQVMGYIRRQSYEKKSSLKTLSGLKVDELGGSLLLTHEEKNWSILVDASGRVVYSFSAEDFEKTRLLSAQKTIEDAYTNMQAVANGEVTDVHQRLTALREAFRIIKAVPNKNNLLDVLGVSGENKETKDVLYDDIAAVLSPEVRSFFAERVAQTENNLPYTEQVVDLLADTIRNAPKEYFAEVADMLSSGGFIRQRLSGEDKLMRAFLDNPDFNEELTETIRSYEAFPQGSKGWGADITEASDGMVRIRLLNIVGKIKEITDFKLKEHLDKGGDIDDFEQPFKRDLAKLFGFAPIGDIGELAMLTNLKKTRDRDYKNITLYEKAYLVFSSYDGLHSDAKSNVRFMLGFNTAGTSLQGEYYGTGELLKSVEGNHIDAAEQEQLREHQQKVRSATDKIRGRLQERINQGGERDAFSSMDLFDVTIHDRYNASGIYGDYNFETIIENRYFEKFVLHYLENGSRDDILNSAFTLDYLIQSGEGTKESEAYKEKIWPSINKLFQRSDISTRDEVASFNRLARYNCFGNDYKRYYEILIGADGKSGLLEAIRQMPDSLNRYECYKELLDKNSRVPDPEIRADIIKNAAESFWQANDSYNDITNSSEYERDSFIKKIEKVKTSNIAELDKVEFLKELSELTLSQKKLSLAMKPKEIEIETTDAKAIKAAYGIDIVAYALQRYPGMKEEIQDFLLGNGTLEEAKNLAESIKINMCKEHDKYCEPKILDRYLKGEDVASDIPYIVKREYFEKINPQACLHFKKEFDAAPLEIKSLIVNEIITNGNYEWKQSFKIVADKLFSDAGELGKVGKDFLHSYIAARPNSEKTFYLAAMMAAANNKSKSSENYADSPYTPEERNMAKGLRLFLENSGPAGTKLAQAMASYPEVPEFIRYEMQFTKSEANPPARWDLFSGKEEAMEKLLKIGPLGKRRGSASFFVTYDLGDKIVKIMRRGAKIKADKEFEIYREMLQKLSSRYKNISSFKRLVQNAAENVYIETDLNIGEKQYKDAKELYPESVTANDVKFDIKVMDWMKHEEDWAIMEKAQGVDFKQLEEPYKTAAAKAVFTTELSNMLSGKRFDFDRHGGQYKFDTENNVIGVFDTGAMSVFEPSDKERQALGTLFARTLRGLRHNQDVAAVFNAEVDNIINEQYQFEISKNYHIPPYLSEFQRGMLALNDFYSGLSGKDVAECIVNAMDNGKNHIHPQIVKAFKLEVKRIIDSHNVSIKEILNPEKTDDLAPEARANRRVGKILFDAVFEGVSSGKGIDLSSENTKKLMARLTNSDSDLQIVKGVVRGAYAKLNPQNYSQTDREELGMFLYHVCQADIKNHKIKKEQALEDVIAEMAAKYPHMGEYTQNAMKLVALMAKTLTLSDDKLKKAAAFVAFADNDVARGYKKALAEDKSVGFAKRIMLNLQPMDFIPQNAKKKLIKAVSKRFVVNYVSKQLFGTTRNLAAKSAKINS